jgi:hypothetical protein
MIPEFKEFDKIPRLNREVTITEKIDGTNACVVVVDEPITYRWWQFPKTEATERRVYAQSRNRLLTPDNDNAGFCKWVESHSEELKNLGPGYHYGEWWGLGIGRKYGMKEKVFNLFNVYRWNVGTGGGDVPPACCRVVPVIPFHKLEDVSLALGWLKAYGSAAAPSFMDPEGICIWHDAAKHYFKVTIKGDESRKGQK